MTSDFNSPAPAAEISRRARVFCAFTTAFLLWFPVQKLGWFPLAWFGLAPFLWAASALPSRARFRYGWAAGFGFYWLTNWWIVPTVIYGSPMIGASPVLGALLGIIAVCFIAAVHGLQFALAAWLWDEKRWAGKLWILPILIAFVWAIFDVLRCIGPLSHIWGALAFTQWRDTAFLQIAPLVGQHGITALIVWFGASLALWRRTQWKPVLVTPLCVFGVVHFYGIWAMKSEIGPTKHWYPSVLLVSTNVSSLHKNGEAHNATPAEEAQWFSLRGKSEAPRLSLAVWPETTLEVLDLDGQLEEAAPRRSDLRRLKETNSILAAPILTGVIHHRLSESDEEIFNEALLFRNTRDFQTSPKIRTVPMGEKAPFGEWIPFLRRFSPKPEVTSGKEVKTLDFKGIPIGTVICFESAFPDPARTVAKKGAKMLFILTNDEWFKGTTAPWEHATMAVMRAAENRVPVAQVANGGYTLLVDKRGRILHQSFGAGATPVEIPF